MFDARSILDAIISGSSEQTRNVRESGGLNDIMSDILGQMQQPGSVEPRASNEPQASSDRQRQAAPRNPLDDLFGQLGGGSSSFEPQAQAEAPERSGGQAQSRSAAPMGYDDMLEQFKDLVSNNKAAAGAIVGGLGGLLLGTRTGRSLTTKAVKVGGLALIGTLAYKAYQDYQNNSSQSSGDPRSERQELPELPPGGSGFEAEAMSDDDAVLFIRTMAAAAMADGGVDHKEQRKILGNLEQAGLEEQAMSFLANEFNHPASVHDIIGSVRTREQAVKVYTAARIAIEPDTRAEQEFLAVLAQRLDLDRRLVAHIDATASGIKVK